MEFSGTKEYISTSDLTVAVNASIALEKPLLVKGEPGTGKTELAKQIANSLDLEIIEWSIKSTTKAQQGLYEYDAVSRLRDSQLGNTVKKVEKYIKKGKLWISFETKNKSVLLIDEIDKADIEFPNDLLQELDKMEFHVYETGQLVKAKNRPIVIITSNRTREVHDALKRRCYYSWVDYPDKQTELDILKQRVPHTKPTLQTELINFVQHLREKDLYKAPGIAETIDWAEALVELNCVALDPQTIDSTIGVLLKYQDDIAKIQGSEASKILNDVKIAVVTQK